MHRFYRESHLYNGLDLTSPANRTESEAHPMATQSTRRILAVVSDVDIGMAFSTPGNHRQVWSIPVPKDRLELSFNQVYSAMWSLHPTIVIVPTIGYIELLEGIRAICRVRGWTLLRHSPERIVPQTPYAREYLTHTRRGGVNDQTTDSEVRALAHVMTHLEEQTRDATARIMKRLDREAAKLETEMIGVTI